MSDSRIHEEEPHGSSDDDCKKVFFDDAVQMSLGQKLACFSGSNLAVPLLPIAHALSSHYRILISNLCHNAKFSVKLFFSNLAFHFKASLRQIRF